MFGLKLLFLPAFSHTSEVHFGPKLMKPEKNHALDSRLETRIGLVLRKIHPRCLNYLSSFFSERHFLSNFFPCLQLKIQKIFLPKIRSPVNERSPLGHLQLNDSAQIIAHHTLTDSMFRFFHCFFFPQRPKTIYEKQNSTISRICVIHFSDWRAVVGFVPIGFHGDKVDNFSVSRKGGDTERVCFVFQHTTATFTLALFLSHIHCFNTTDRECTHSFSITNKPIERSIDQSNHFFVVQSNGRSAIDGQHPQIFLPALCVVLLFTCFSSLQSR